MKHIYTSIDIGSDTVKIVVCELYNNRLNLLAASSVKSKGIKKGLITDVDEATSSVRKAFNELEEMLGIRIEKVIAGVPSYSAEYNMIRGQIEIDEESQYIVTGDDVVSVLQSAMKGQSLKEREMITIIPVDFTLDEQKNIKDPKGMTGKALSVRAVLVTTPRKNVTSVVSLLENMGVDVVDISLNSIGDVNTFKNSDLMNKVGAIINIGHDTTTVSLYNKGIAVKSSIIGLGGHNVDNDIAYIYKISSNTASSIKEHFAYAHKSYASQGEIREVKDKEGNIIKINNLEVTEIVESRLEEILTSARKEINLLTKREVDYILVTGGTSSMSGFEAMANEVLGKKSRVGSIKVIGVRNNKYSSALGNIIYFISKLKLKEKNYSMVSRDDMEEISSLKKSFVTDDSMLGKVFGYFFSE